MRKKCSCGFTYSRSGPDKNAEDMYRIGFIKEYGDVWKNKLKTTVVEGVHGLREIARIMKCDPKTVIKYSSDLGILELVNTSIQIHDTKSKESDFIEVTYKDEFIKVYNEHPSCTRKEMKDLMGETYRWLYSNCREWLKKFKFKNEKNIRKPNRNNRVDWKKEI